MSQEILSPNQINLYQANLYIFTKDVYTRSDLFYMWTSDHELTSQSRIIAVNTIYRDITNILDSDYVGNIYLYRQWTDGTTAVFIRDLVQEARDKVEAVANGTAIILPPITQRLRNLEIRNTGAIKNPTSSRIIHNQLTDTTTVNFSYLI